MTKENSPIASEVIDVLIDDTIQNDFAQYAFYTIRERALPDIRDGLKPVQRRVTFTAYSEGFLPHKATVKSARIVGSCMGQFHPHGDVSIYESMVRLAQKHSVFLPLFDSEQGNFGAPGRNAAASRYTETRLSPYGYSSTIELREKVAPMKPTFDESGMEPVVLPVRLPLLLINGSSGIAVALATNMPPHNPREAIKATLHMIDNQDKWRQIRDSEEKEKEALMGELVDDLMKIIPDPDLPTGGVIMGVDSIRSAYLTGRGKFIIRGKYHIEPLPKGKKAIVFTEIPYGESQSGIIDAVIQAEYDHIGSLRAYREWEATGRKGRQPKPEGFKLEGVTDVKNLSGKDNPCKLVFELDAKTNPDAVLAQLFKHTKLETSFGINNNCIVDGTPRVVSLPEILQHFISFRRKLVKRRLENERESNAQRAYFLEGLQLVLLDIDKAIRIIRGAENQAKAREELQKVFTIDEAQAKYVTDMKLGRLTKYDTVELGEELEGIKKRLRELDGLIGSREEILGIVKSELEEILTSMEQEGKDPSLKKYPTVRRSEIVEASLKDYNSEKKALQLASAEVEDEPVTLYLAPSGKTVFEKPSVWSLSIPTSTRGDFYAVTDTGYVVRVDTLNLLGGDKIGGLESGEKVVALLSGKKNLALASRRGVIYYSVPAFPSSEARFAVVKLAEGDSLVGGAEVEGAGDRFTFISSDSSTLLFKEEALTVRKSINGGGVVGMKLRDGQEVLHFTVVPEGVEASVATSTGESLKVSPLSEYPTKGRGSYGVRSHTFRKGEECLTQALVGENLVILPEGLRKPQGVEGFFKKKRDASGEKLETPTSIFNG